MSFDLKPFQKKLAQQKVYDAWQYVNSLNEMLMYMKMTYELLEKVYNQRNMKLKEKEQEIIGKVGKSKSASLSESDLHCTDILIADLSIDDSLFLRKTTMEFFHYARVSMDIIFQIINAALLGDSSFDVDDRKIIEKINKELEKSTNFANLKMLLDSNKNNDTFKYIQAFDNYIKHIKTILITIKNNFIFGNNNKFIIQEFVNNGVVYPEKDVILTVRQSNKYILDTVETILGEIETQIPNCVDNSQRIQSLSYKVVAKELENGIGIDYVSFFIDVEKELSELPNEIKVLPLIINSKDEIYSFDFKFKKIFIRRKDTDESGIVGYAEIKNGFDTNEFYRIFTVHPCTMSEYHSYTSSFAKENYKVSINHAAMNGTVLIYKD